MNKIGIWFVRHCIHYRYRFLQISISVIEMFEKFILRRVFYRANIASAFSGIRNILLYFLFNCNNICFVFLIFNFNFYKPESLAITESTIFRIEYQWIL